MLLPHDKNILRCELEDKTHDIERILHKTVKDKYKHWNNHRIQQFIKINMKITMFYEIDMKDMALHRRPNNINNLKFLIFRTMTTFKSNPDNTKKWHWYHDRCRPQGDQVKVSLPKKDKNIHDCHLHQKQTHKLKPKGYSKPYEPHMIPNKNEADNKE